MERTILDFWVGIFVVAGIAALVMLAMKVGNLSTYNMSESYQVHAYFSNIGGLKPKASIKSAGVLVGRVTDITLDTERYEAKDVYKRQVPHQAHNTATHPESFFATQSCHFPFYPDTILLGFDYLGLTGSSALL